MAEEGARQQQSVLGTSEPEERCPHHTVITDEAFSIEGVCGKCGAKMVKTWGLAPGKGTT